MMIENRVGRRESRRLQACVLSGALLVLPLGMAYAQDYEAVGKRLRAAVEAEELTGEQARFMLGALRLAEDLGGPTEEKRLTREDYVAAEAEMKAMVERGEVSAKDVRTRLREMRKVMDRQGGKRGDDREVDWDAVQERIEGAVERGKLTREQADAKYTEIKRRSSGTKDADELEWDVIKQRIEHAVERGDITREQADATYRALKK